jgi:hypothetical protein
MLNPTCDSPSRQAAHRRLRAPETGSTAGRRSGAQHDSFVAVDASLRAVELALDTHERQKPGRQAHGTNTLPSRRRNAPAVALTAMPRSHTAEAGQGRHVTLPLNSDTPETVMPPGHAHGCSGPRTRPRRPGHIESSMRRIEQPPRPKSSRRRTGGAVSRPTTRMRGPSSLTASHEDRPSAGCAKPVGQVRQALQPVLLANEPGAHSSQSAASRKAASRGAASRVSDVHAFGITHRRIAQERRARTLSTKC